MNPERTLAKIERPALLPVLEEAIGQLPDTSMRGAMRLTLTEGLSEKAIEKRRGVSDTTVRRRLLSAYDLLRPQREARRVDESWVAA